MQCQVTGIYAGAAHKVAIHIVEHLVTVDIVVVVRCGDRLGMEVVRSGNKVADNKVVGGKHQMIRWGQVNLAYLGRVLCDVEGPGVDKTVPTHQIKRMPFQLSQLILVAKLADQRELPLLYPGLCQFGYPDIPLAIGADSSNWP